MQRKYFYLQHLAQHINSTVLYRSASPPCDKRWNNQHHNRIVAQWYAAGPVLWCWLPFGFCEGSLVSTGSFPLLALPVPHCAHYDYQHHIAMAAKVAIEDLFYLPRSHRYMTHISYRQQYNTYMFSPLTTLTLSKPHPQPSRSHQSAPI